MGRRHRYGTTGRERKLKRSITRVTSSCCTVHQRYFVKHTHTHCIARTTPPAEAPTLLSPPPQFQPWWQEIQHITNQTTLIA